MIGVGLIAASVWNAVNVVGNCVSVGVTDAGVDVDDDVSALTIATLTVAGDDVGDSVYTLL